MTNEKEILAKRTIYDSVFTDLFKMPEYTLQLYQALHPEDTGMTKEQIQIVTLENLLLNQPYNDLGFTAGNRLLIFVEAQSTWTENILVRVLIYMAQTIQNHITDTRQNVYGKKKVSFPEMEFYVVFTGERKDRRGELVLSEEFFGGRRLALEVRVKMVYDGMEGDIISQYVAFTRIYREQCKKYGRTQKAVLETIRLCRKKDILKEYLENREKEVVDIMMTLFNQEYAIEAYTEEIRQESIEKGIEQGRREGGMMKAKETALNLLNMGFTAEQAAEAIKVNVQQVWRWIEGGTVLEK